MKAAIRIGTAAWNLPRDYRDLFAQEGSHLQRYATRFNAVEINSSFYRPHQAKTYERWAASVPDNFEFSVKLEKLFTHERRLKDPGKELQDRLQNIEKLGRKMGCLLIQLPPSLYFEIKPTAEFFAELRRFYRGDVVFEPRHESWLSKEALRMLEDFNLSWVVADPEPFPIAGKLRFGPIAYHRLHGSPQIYKSEYSDEFLADYADRLIEEKDEGRKIWCIFDNTTYGYATRNALDLHERIVHSL